MKLTRNNDSASILASGLVTLVYITAVERISGKTADVVHFRACQDIPRSWVRFSSAVTTTQLKVDELLKESKVTELISHTRLDYRAFECVPKNRKWPRAGCTC